MKETKKERKGFPIKKKNQKEITLLKERNK